MADTFAALTTLAVGERSFVMARLDALASEVDIARLPYTLRILLENVLRAEALGHGSVSEVRAVARWDPARPPDGEIAFRPGRVLLQDFTGVPAVVDLAAMRDGDARRSAAIPQRINPLAARRARHRPLRPGRRLRHADSRFARNVELEYERNQRAVRVPALGPAGVPTTSASSRRTRASSTR